MTDRRYPSRDGRPLCFCKAPAVVRIHLRKTNRAGTRDWTVDNCAAHRFDLRPQQPSMHLARIVAVDDLTTSDR